MNYYKQRGELLELKTETSFCFEIEDIKGR